MESTRSKVESEFQTRVNSPAIFGFALGARVPS